MVLRAPRGRHPFPARFRKRETAQVELVSAVSSRVATRNACSGWIHRAKLGSPKSFG